MKKIWIFVLAVIFLLITVTAQADRVTVVLVGGASGGASYMEFLQKSIPGAIIIVPDRLSPIWEAAEDTWRKIQEAGVTGKVILVGHSWGGLTSRGIAASHPKEVIAVVTIVSPNGGYRFCPNWIFSPWDDESNVPLYVIAAYKEELGERWFFRGPNDGTVDVISMIDTGREARDVIILSGLDHMEVLQSEAVVGVINHWIAPYIYVDRTVVASAERIQSDGRSGFAP